MTVQLPDFDDMAKMIENIYEASLRKMMLDLEIHSKEAEIIRQSVSDENFFVNGKPPSIAYLESTVKFTGANGELVEMRKALSESAASLERSRLLYDLMVKKIEVWRSQTANERIASQV
jgi:hypothetical protein